MSLFDHLIRLALPTIPKAVIWTVARRYVAGAELSDALDRIAQIRSDGFGTILDVLGEGISDLAAAEEAATEYRKALAALPPVDPDCPISVKPTHLGCLLDRATCERLLGELCTAAAEQGRRVRLEMESADTVDATLAVFQSVHKGHSNLGCVLQARLFRTAGDVERLLAEEPGLDVRLVKGIYIEPSEIAWTDDVDISRSFIELAEKLVAGGAFVGFATHDNHVADACIDVAARHGVGAHDGRYEFQLLMGVRRDEAERLRDEGHPVRIYVPYGRDWHAYTQRRLSRNPEIARHVLKALLRRR